jgi:integrase
MAGTLATIARHIWGAAATIDSAPWHQLRRQHVAALRSSLAEHYAPATVNKYLSAVKGALTEAWQMGLIDPDDYARAKAVAGVRGSRLPAGRAVDRHELLQLIAACAAADGALACRDAALIALLYNSGVRREELCNIDLADVDGLAVRITRGKGNKERMAYINDGTRHRLDAWLEYRGQEPGPLFCRVLRSGRPVLTRLSCTAAWKALATRARQAGLGTVTPHDLRRSTATHLLEAQVDINVVAGMLGHASITTTARYDRRGEKAKRSAATVLEAV